MSGHGDEQGRATAAGGQLRRQLLARMPVTERRLDLAGIPTAVLAGGDGPPVVLLHGPGEFAATWMRVVPQLARTHRVVAPDLPGHGASGLPASGLDAERVLAWLDALVEQTCASPPTLVGHLLGGALAARSTARHGERVDRLVLVDSFGLGRFRPAPTFALAMVGFVAHPSERTQRRLFERCFANLDGLRAQMGDDLGLLEAYALDRARTSTLKGAIRSLMRDFGTPVIAPAELERITVPTTLIWGREDLQVRLPVAEAASARYGWPLHVVDGAADDPAVERPEAFLRALHAALGTPTTEEATR